MFRSAAATSTTRHGVGSSLARAVAMIEARVGLVLVSDTHASNAGAPPSECARLGCAAADPHRAPAARGIPGVVVVRPLTGIVGADLHPRPRPVDLRPLDHAEEPCDRGGDRAVAGLESQLRVRRKAEADPYPRGETIQSA